MSLKKIRGIGAQNDEPHLAKFLKEYSDRNLENVKKISNNQIELTFSDSTFKGKQRRRVVQLKKENYRSKKEVKKMFEQETVNNNYIEERLWHKVWVIELPDKWLVFCKR